MNIERSLRIVTEVAKIIVNSPEDTDIRAKVFQKYSKEEIKAVVAYLKSLEESQEETPKDKAVKKDNS